MGCGRPALEPRAQLPQARIAPYVGRRKRDVGKAADVIEHRRLTDGTLEEKSGGDLALGRTLEHGQQWREL